MVSRVSQGLAGATEPPASRKFDVVTQALLALDRAPNFRTLVGPNAIACAREEGPSELNLVGRMGHDRTLVPGRCANRQSPRGQRNICVNGVELLSGNRCWGQQGGSRCERLVALPIGVTAQDGGYRPNICLAWATRCMASSGGRPHSTRHGSTISMKTRTPATCRSCCTMAT